ncbi:MAG: SGNH/GDSL hydrolase family protein [Clostridia bacterium]|nr:SGNH/GDSL hydrolase family protein [Clostridia bacterium]
MKKIPIPKSFVIFGDSIGRGVMYDPSTDSYETDRGFVAMLEKHWGIRAVNYTRFGQTISKGLKMLEKKLESIRACDFVFLEFGGNDSDYDWKAIASDPEAFYEPKTALSEFVSLYKKLIKTVRDAGLTPIVLNLPPIDHDMYFDRVRHGCNGDNILRWLKGDKTTISRWHANYSAEINKLCREIGAKLIDIRSAFEGRELSELLCPDGIHPNENGHKLICEKILNEFC